MSTPKIFKKGDLMLSVLITVRKESERERRRQKDSNFVLFYVKKKRRTPIPFVVEEGISLAEGHTLSYMSYKYRNKFLLVIAKLFIVLFRK